MSTKIYSFGEYQEEAQKTIPVNLTPEEVRDNAVYGICGEIGELIDILKKVKFQGHAFTEETKRHIILECGDILWYLSEMATGLNINLNTIATMNIDKIRARYGDQFDSQKSQNRKEGDI